jgi:hypothetical protein
LAASQSALIAPGPGSDTKAGKAHSFLGSKEIFQ